MNEMINIDRLVGLDTDSQRDETDREYNDAELAVDGDIVVDLQDTIMQMKMTIDVQDKRISKLEVDLQRVMDGAYTERTRTTAGLPPPYAMRRTTSPTYGDTGSESGGRPSTANDDVISVSSNGVIRSDSSVSAISNKGYDNKASIWGTVFASLLVSCMRTYINKSGETAHVVDETSILKACIGVVGNLYMKSSFRELPQVQSNEVTFLSTMFNLKSKNEVPVSSVNTWKTMMEHTDGAPCMEVIEHIMTGAKLVPEALTYPVSRIVAVIGQPVVVITNMGPVYALLRGTKIGTVPNGYERVCSFLKKDALKTYVKLRLDGYLEVDALCKMQNTIRESEMFDNI